MKFLQKPPLFDQTSSLLVVNSDTFAELKSESNDFYSFNIFFKLILNNTSKNIKNYDKVVVTVKTKEPKAQQLASAYSGYVDQSRDQVDNIGKNKTTNESMASSYVKSLKPDNGLPAPKVSMKLAERLYSGIKMVKDLQTNDPYLDRANVSIDGIFEEYSKNIYTVTEIFAPQYKVKRRFFRQLGNSQKTSRDVPSPSLDPSSEYQIDPSNILDRINSELCDITSPVSKEGLKELTSESDLDDKKTRTELIVGRSFSPLDFDMARYFLSDVKSSPQESEMKWYEKRIVSKRLDDLDAKVEVKINKAYKNSNLVVRFDLYERSTNTVEESISVGLNMSDHIEAYDSILVPPIVNVINVQNSSMCILTVTDGDQSGRTLGFNIYIKNIHQTGIVDAYKKIGSLNSFGGRNLSMWFMRTSDLSVLRVVPFDMKNRESSVFTNYVIGPGHSSVGSLTITASHVGRGEVVIDIFGLPKGSMTLTLFRRDCTDNVDGSFEAIKSESLNNPSSAQFVDTDILPDKVYEYYVSMTRESEAKSFDFKGPRLGNDYQASNYVILKNSSLGLDSKSITVSVSNVEKKQDPNGESVVSFDISTEIVKSENERLTETLKERLGELYEQYLNPANNPASPLGTGLDGVPIYKDLIFHEVVRTCLNTGERETFELVSDGLFVDNGVSQKKYNVRPVNPTLEYVYQIFTFLKNPITLFKNYVARGTNEKSGKEWFYLPYKWKNIQASRGTLYADGDDNKPVIEAYESFTSDSYGLTAMIQSKSSSQFTTLTQITARRIDRNTVKISWSYTGASSLNKLNLYDSFVVLKVVNGIRSFVGRSNTNFIYHELSGADVGTVYYIVVPVMAEFDIDEPGYSNEILVTPDNLIEKVKNTNLSMGVVNSASEISPFFNRGEMSPQNTAKVERFFENGSGPRKRR
jgi:hypothetical protein